MAEAGGTAIQSGIHYQNSVAALYLGRLLDPRQRTASDLYRVIADRDDGKDIHRSTYLAPATFLGAKRSLIRGHLTEKTSRTYSTRIKGGKAS